MRASGLCENTAHSGNGSIYGQGTGRRVAVLLGAAWGGKFSVIDFIFSVKYESRSLTESEDGRGGDGDWRQMSVRWSPRTVGESEQGDRV